MAQFAKLGPGDKVLEVIVVHDNEAPTEAAGIEFLETIFGKGFVWKQTFKVNENNPRKNFAGRGFHYDKAKDAFIRKRPFKTWVLNESTCRWEAPVPKPDDGQEYSWNDSTGEWEVWN